METNNKLREACANIAEYARSAMCHTTDTHMLGYLNQIEGWAKAALAEPVKNYEVGTAEEQWKRFDEFCDAWQESAPVEICSDECPVIKMKNIGCDGCQGCLECYTLWAQMPYEKGGAK